MRSLILVASAALALSGCEQLGGIPLSPGTVSNHTVLDERAGSAVELGYKLFRTALELAVDSGKLKGADAQKAAALDNHLYAAVGAVRSAYRAANAASYAQAVDQANALLAQVDQVLPKH